MSTATYDLRRPAVGARVRDRTRALRWARAWVPGGGVFALSLLGYLRTLQPAFGWGDSSELATAVRFLGVGHSPGYPTFMLLAHAFCGLPLGNYAHRVNLFNAVCGATAATLAYVLFARLVKSRVAAFAAALTFAFSATCWDATTDVDVHRVRGARRGAPLRTLARAAG